MYSCTDWNKFLNFNSRRHFLLLFNIKKNIKLRMFCVVSFLPCNCHVHCNCRRDGLIAIPRKRNWGGKLLGFRDRRIYRLWTLLAKYGHRVFGPQMCVGSRLRETGKTVNIGSYSVTLLLLRASIKRKRPEMFPKVVQLLHDNNRPHSANVTRQLLQPFRWEILEHPAYSAVLAPSDYHLFSAKRSFWSPHTSKWCRSEQNYDAAVVVAKHGILSTGNLEATSVIWKISQFWRILRQNLKFHSWNCTYIVLLEEEMIITPTCKFIFLPPPLLKYNHGG
jgi:hypothetical protein